MKITLNKREKFVLKTFNDYAIDASKSPIDSYFNQSYEKEIEGLIAINVLRRTFDIEVCKLTDIGESLLNSEEKEESTLRGVLEDLLAFDNKLLIQKAYGAAQFTVFSKQSTVKDTSKEGKAVSNAIPIDHHLDYSTLPLIQFCQQKVNES